MKVLLTGESGFIGGNLAQRLRAEGYTVHCWRRDDDLQAVLEQFTPAIIINCAAEIYQPHSMFDINVGMVHTLLKWCNEWPVRLIQLGSSSEYGPVERSTHETTPVNPTDCYGATKAAASLLVQGFAQQHQIDAVVLRLYSPYGPGEKPHRLFPNLWRAARLNKPMTLKQGVHDFTYIDDVVDAVMLVVHDSLPRYGEVYNVCNSVQYSNFEVATMFELETGRALPITRDPEWTTPKIWRGDNSKFCDKFNWRPTMHLSKGIQKFLKEAKYE